jgi:hypothetical protein
MMDPITCDKPAVSRSAQQVEMDHDDCYYKMYKVQRSKLGLTCDKPAVSRSAQQVEMDHDDCA